MAGNHNVVVTTDHEVMSVTTAGDLAWHTPITDPHPEFASSHQLDLWRYLDRRRIGRRQGPRAAPDDVGGSILKLDNATGAVVSSADTYEPAAPIGYSGTASSRQAPWRTIPSRTWAGDHHRRAQ